ncbi:hypothetical protein D3C87_1404790 [compost metagenome]
MGVGLDPQFAGAALARFGGGEQGQGIVVGQSPHRPQRLAPVLAQGSEGVGVCQFAHGGGGQFGAAGQGFDIDEGPVTGGDQGLGPVLPEPFDLTQTQPQGRRCLRPLQTVVPMAVRNIDGPHLDPAYLLRLAHDLGGRIKAHRLAVQQGAGEGRRVVVLDPRGDIDQLRE